MTRLRLLPRRHSRPGSHHRPVATALVVACAGAALAGCGDTADDVSPERMVADAVDNLSAVNTGRYTIDVELAEDGTLHEEGRFSVVPDASATLRRRTVDERTRTVRFLRQGNDVWVEVEGSETRDVRTGCWVMGQIGDVVRATDRSRDDVERDNAVVETVLSLQGGELTEDGDLVAQASLADLAGVLGARSARRLDVPRKRVDVPVTLTLDDEGRVTAFDADLGTAVREVSPLVLSTDLPGTVHAEITDYGLEADLLPPEDLDTIDATSPAEEVEAYLAGCRD